MKNLKHHINHLGLTSCPTQEVADTFKEFNSEEEVYQSYMSLYSDRIFEKSGV